MVSTECRKGSRVNSGRPGGADRRAVARPMTLRTRWLGRVPYREAWALQRALHAHSPDDHLLLLEHPHVYTLGVRADLGHVLVPPAEVGADLVRTDRGGDVTYHGPGQLVGYPIVSLPAKRGGGQHGIADTVAYVRSVEQLLIDALADVGLPGAGRLRRVPRRVGRPRGRRPRKIAAIGVRLTRGRSMHGFALNVAPDMRYWGYIVPCGIPDKRVTSLADEGVDVSVREVTDAVAARAAALWGGLRGRRRRGRPARRRVAAPARRPVGLQPGRGPRREASRATGRTACGTPSADPSPTRRRAGAAEGPAGAGGRHRGARRSPSASPSGCARPSAPTRLPAAQAHDARPRPRHRVRGGRLPEHLRVLGRRHGHVHDQRRALHAGVRVLPGRHPPPRGARPGRARAGGRGGRAHGPRLRGGHRRRPRRPGRRRGRGLRRDDRGHPPPHPGRAGRGADPRLQGRRGGPGDDLRRPPRRAEPQRRDRAPAPAGRAPVGRLRPEPGRAGPGQGGGPDDQVGPHRRHGRDRRRGACRPWPTCAAVGVDIVTIGQYLRPTTHHLPVARWVEPAAFDALQAAGEAMGIAHVESSPLTRSSYHARQAAGSTAPSPRGRPLSPACTGRRTSVHSADARRTR